MISSTLWLDVSKLIYETPLKTLNERVKGPAAAGEAADVRKRGITFYFSCTQKCGNEVKRESKKSEYGSTNSIKRANFNQHRRAA